MGNRYNNVAGDFGGRNCNSNVAGDFGGRNCNGNVAGDFGRRCRCRCNAVLADRIALRGPGCISGTGRCGNFTASFVESNGRFAEGYGNVAGSFGYCGQVSPAGNMQTQGIRRRNNDCGCCDCLRTPTIVPR